jgi:choline dehydrogenase
MCTYASIGDIDNWAKLGNLGWTHEELAPYFKKFESFTEPSKDIEKFYHTDNIVEEDLHDAGGPVKTSFPNNKRFAAKAWVKTFNNLGLKMTTDPQTGKGNGGYRSVLPLHINVSRMLIQLQLIAHNRCHIWNS